MLFNSLLNSITGSLLGSIIEGDDTPNVPTTNLVAWYDAAKISNFVTTGNNVSQWNDISGNDHHITQTTPLNQPLINSESLANKNVLSFDGVSSYMNFPSSIFPFCQNSNTVFIVSRRRSENGSGMRLLSFVRNTGDNKYFCGYLSNAGEYRFSSNGGGTGFLTDTGVDSTQYNIFVNRREGVTQGIGINSTTEITNGGGAQSINIVNGYLGVSNFANANFLDGSIAEIIIYNESLSVDDRQDVIDYLTSKWRIADCLPYSPTAYWVLDLTPEQQAVVAALNLDSCTADGVLETAFTSTWKTDNAGVSNSDQITIPTISSGNYNCVVDWGDGNVSSRITSWDDPQWTHTYSAAGTYEVKIYGTFKGILFSGTTDKLKITSVTQWGIFNPGNQIGTFRGCANMTLDTITDAMDLTDVVVMQAFFRDCSSITTIGGLDLWDTSSAQFMTAFFINCVLFNQPISFDTSNVGAISFMFSNCLAFDQNVGNLNLSSVTNINNFMLGVTLSNANYNLTLDGWAGQAPNLTNGLTINMGDSECDTTSGGVDGIAAKAVLTGVPIEWNIIDKLTI